MSKIFILLIISSFSFISCTGHKIRERRPYLRGQARNVRVIKQFPKNCVPEGMVSGVGAANASGQTVWTFAMNDMRNKAAARGIYTVVLERYKHSSANSMLMVKVFGRLMRCEGRVSRRRTARRAPANIYRRRRKKNKTPASGYDTVSPTPPPAPAGDVGDPGASQPPARGGGAAADDI